MTEITGCQEETAPSVVLMQQVMKIPQGSLSSKNRGKDQGEGGGGAVSRGKDWILKVVAKLNGSKRWLLGH